MSYFFPVAPVQSEDPFLDDLTRNLKSRIAEAVEQEFAARRDALKNVSIPLLRKEGI